MSKSSGDFIDYYQLLGIAMTADIATIKHAYRTQIARHHPDRAADGDAQMARLLNTAYATLKDTDARKAYDARLLQHRQKLWLSAKKYQFVDTVTNFAKRQSQKFSDKLGEKFGDKFAENFTEQFAEKAGQWAGQAVQNATAHAKRLWERLGKHSSLSDLPDDLPICAISLDTAFGGGQVRLHVGERVLQASIPKGLSHGEVLRIADGDDVIAVRIVIDTPNVSVCGADVYYTAQISGEQARTGAQIELPTPLSLRLTLPADATYPTSIRLSGRGLPRDDGAGDLVVVFAVRA